MRTRRSRGLKQTRRGGNPVENRKNWEMHWSDKPYNPYTKYPNRVQGRLYGTFTPTVSKELNMQKTYIIQRHGFSCANLQKAKDKKKNRGVWHAKLTNPSLHSRVEDPSLTAYGIYSLLREEERPDKYGGTVYGSSLLRTWQTAIVVYGKYGPCKIVVSPYIKENHGSALDLSNFPLPFEQQMAYMEQFMQFLKGIDHPIAREIIRHEHIIEYNGNSYPLGPLKEMYTVSEDPIMAAGKFYVDTLSHTVNLSPSSREDPLEMDAFIPAITKIPEPSFREYYGAEGLVYFDRWVSKKTTSSTIFVVSHSNWMQTVIETYCGPVVTNIFDENAWILKITPSKFKSRAAVKFYIIPGVPKPKDEELDHMNRVSEPTCNLLSRPSTLPTGRPPPPREPLPLPRAAPPLLRQSSHGFNDVNSSPLLRQSSHGFNDVEAPPLLRQSSHGFNDVEAPRQESLPRAPPPRSLSRQEDPSAENVELLNDENASPISVDDISPDDIDVAYRASDDPFQANVEADSVVDQVRSNSQRASKDPFQANVEADSVDRVRSNSQASQTSQASQSSLPRASRVSQVSERRSSFNLVKEVSPTETNLVSVPVTTEKTHIITRSFVELGNMMLDSTIRAGLRELILSQEEFNTKLTNYVNSNPRIMILDPVSYLNPRIPIYLFQNHYLAFVLMFKEEYEELLDFLPTSTVVTLALRGLGLTVNIVISFLRDLRQHIEDNAVFHNLLLSKFAANANKHYAFLTTKAIRQNGKIVEKDVVYSFTLLDLFMFEIQRHPITTENMYFMYGCFIDLIRYGARNSVSVYEQPSSMFSSIKMPMVELERLPQEMELTQRWEREKRALDPENKLARYQEDFEEITRTLRQAEYKLQSLYKLKDITDPVARAVALEKIQREFYAKNRPLLDAVERIRRDYHAEKQKLGFDRLPAIRDEIQKKFERDIYTFLNGALADYLPDPSNYPPDDPRIPQMKEVIQAHKDIFNQLLYSSEPIVSIGGLRGTSWKRTLLRQSSVKAGRYRASLYKGKRRTRANRS